MIDIKASNIIQLVVDKFLDRKTPAEYDEDYHERTAHGLVFDLRANLSSYGETLDDNGDVRSITCDAREHVFILFTGGTSVFVAMEPRNEHWMSWRDVPLASWRNTSNHDSCWRSDGLDSPLSALYFHMADEVNAKREKDGLPNVAPAQMHQFNNLNSGLFKELRVTTVTDPDGDNPGYHRKIQKLTTEVNS